MEHGSQHFILEMCTGMKASFSHLQLSLCEETAESHEPLLNPFRCDLQRCLTKRSSAEASTVPSSHGRPIHNGGCSKHDPTISATPDQTPSPADPGDAPNTAKHTSLRSLPFSRALVTGTLSHLSSFPCDLQPNLPKHQKTTQAAAVPAAPEPSFHCPLRQRLTKRNGRETSTSLQDHETRHTMLEK